MKKKVVALAYYGCLGGAGLVFALGCLVIAVSGLVLDLLAFLGLLGVAFGSLVYGRVKRMWVHREAMTFQGLGRVLENPVRK
jgi:hypothetical protein